MEYNDCEKLIHNWLLTKHNKDHSFTFSVRKKSAKGAEKDIFIGTKKGGYFGTTFWTIKIEYEGASSDLIDLFFKTENDGIGYYFEFRQTMKPYNQQNKLALELIKEIEEKISKKIVLNQRSSNNNYLHYKSKIKKYSYSELNKMFEDIDKDLGEIIPIVDNEITKIKKDNPSFIAERISKLDFDLMQNKLYKRLELPLTDIITTSPVKLNLPDHISPKNLILYGPPGTGKTYNTIRKAVQIIEKLSDEQIKLKDDKLIKESFDNYKTNGQIEFITFHQSYSYEQFVEGISVKTDEKNPSNVIYNIKDGIFKSFGRIKIKNKAPTKSNSINITQDFKNSGYQINLENKIFDIHVYVNNKRLFFEKNKQFTSGKEIILDIKNFNNLQSNMEYDIQIVPHEPVVLIIDEINRGNISKIFGELITLIEDDKRLGEENEIIVTLPYSGEQFGVPPNLYIIGTMNTADRSLVQLDTALRRRFDFEEMMPKYHFTDDIIKLINDNFRIDELHWPNIGKVDEIDLSLFLYKLNQKICKEYDREHQIGHSFLMKVNTLSKDQNGNEQHSLKRAWENRIMPLLQEYFYGDYENLAKIIGEGSKYLNKIENGDETAWELNMRLKDDMTFEDEFIKIFKSL